MSQATINVYTDQTHDPALQSWVESASSGDFPIQNLPFGVMASTNGPRIVVAIGDQALDLRGCVERGLLEVDDRVAAALAGPTLNPLLELGRASWRALRRGVSGLLAADNGALRDDPAARSAVLLDQATATMLMPVTIGDYTDFYASIHHATNIGSMFRPDNPLMPNYRHLPVGYHGRASSIVLSGTPIRRPHGQTRADDADGPTFGPCRLLDYELELGFLVGPGNEMATRLTPTEAGERIFGMAIVNDWSARDVQKWEYQPLGPFNAKNFATSLSPWIVTLEALGPYRVPGPPRGPEDPPLLDYLKPDDDLGLDIQVAVHICSQTMREKSIEPHQLSRGSFADMYWTIGQMLAHHTSTGCNMRPGDLLASGTVSGPDRGSEGCLLELTRRGQFPVDLPDGTQRKLLQDGDEVIITAWCEGQGRPRIGFGACRGVVLPAT